MTNNPVKKAAKNPPKRGQNETLATLVTSLISNKVEPKIVGTAKRKEN